MKVFTKVYNILIIFLLLGFSSLAQSRSTALQIVKSVADRVIEDCKFEFEPVKQEPVLGVQIMDFNREFDVNTIGPVYALSYIQSDTSTSIKLGISASDNVFVFINDKPISFNKSNNPLIKETAYGMFNFNDTPSVSLHKGANKILIKADGLSNSPKIFLRQITDDPESEGGIKFSSSPFLKGAAREGWILGGPFPNPKEETPEDSIKNYYRNDGRFVSWNLPEEDVLAELKIGKNDIFKKDSYADWNYANGETMMSILDLASVSGEQKYNDFVQHWCDFIIKNIPYFEYQYDSLYALRGSYHRIFRKSMLDDAGAPVFPFLQLYLQERNKDYFELINEMAEYVSKKQTRLKDETLCRPEPEKWTVWADDLFMSVPLFLRMGKITGENKYYDDAVKQIKSFNRLLFDGGTGLYKHGWFSKTNKKSAVFWGRANGWIMWAVSEALLFLPKDHEGYSDILNIYKKHIEGLIKYQDGSGMWHQVLNHPESYEESSCTAMFILGIARGINNGWLDKSYSEYALKGWNALSKKIDNGIVHGICRGTGMGDKLEFYFSRPTLDNDPRGLGAVITAGVEISKLEVRKKND